MRLHHVVLIAVAALINSAGALSSATDSDLALPLAGAQDVAANRLLRADGDDEERAFNIKTIPGLDKIKSIPGVEKFAGLFKTKITPGTLLKWAKKGKSPDKVFTTYNLDKTGTKLFESPDFKIWYTYTALVTKTDPEKAILTSLIGRYGEVTLSSMLEGALKLPGMKDVATTLQKKLMQTWKDVGMNADDAFKYLKLHMNVDDVLTNPNLNAWTRYVDDFTVKRKTDTPLIDVLRANYDDAALLKMFNAAKGNPQSKRMATNLEAALVSKLRLQRMRAEMLRHAAGN
uniref:RxLR effector protein n=1 Tax=Phytophthora sojae TaxID=67593 RepID=G1FRN2_PHYSO|nr:Avh154 [Phytophthora sojae]AEK80770.1 Avh154 [Phytophthora sojae]AEK80771.1 Avh154 [Phytophthora sojae]